MQCDSHLSKLSAAISLMAVQLLTFKLLIYFPQRTIAGITAKLNGLYGACRIIVRESAFVLLPESQAAIRPVLIAVQSSGEPAREVCYLAERVEPSHKGPLPATAG